MGCNCITWRLRKGNHELKVNPDYTVGTHPHGVSGRDERQERRKRGEGGGGGTRCRKTKDMQEWRGEMVRGRVEAKAGERGGKEETW